MRTRYRALLALTLACALLGTAHAVPAHRRARHAAAAPSQPAAAAALYSARALRRARTILQLKLLELRALRLERVRKAVERGISVDDLLKMP